MLYDNRRTQEEVITEGETILNELIGVLAVTAGVALAVLMLG